MKKIFKCLAISAFSATVALGAAGAASASQQPLRIIVPYAAGGSGDAIARIMSEQLGPQLGRTVIVENRPGAGGRIAMMALKNAPSDGSSVVLAYTGVVINSIIFSGAKDYDFKTDFAGMAQVGRMPMAVAVSVDHKAKNIQEFVQQLPADKTFTFGTNGTGSFAHLSGIRFANAANLTPNAIAYQGGAPMANDLMGGHLEAAVDTLGDFVERHRGGKIRMLGILSDSRSPLAPEIPTMAEQGIPDTDAQIWLGFFASSKVSADFRQQFEEAVRKSLDDATVQEKLKKMIQIDYKPGSEFSRTVVSDFDAWTPVVTKAGLMQK